MEEHCCFKDLLKILGSEQINVESPTSENLKIDVQFTLALTYSVGRLAKLLRGNAIKIHHGEMLCFQWVN